MRGLAILAALLVALTGFPLLAPAQQEKAAKAANELEGKFFLVFLKSAPNTGAPLEKVSLRRLGDRWFVVGTPIKNQDAAFWLPIDDVHHLREYATRAKLLEALEQQAAGGQP